MVSIKNLETLLRSTECSVEKIVYNKIWVSRKEKLQWSVTKADIVYMVILHMSNLIFLVISLWSTVTRVEISLSFFTSSWVQVGPGLEFPNIEKTGRDTVSIRLVFLGQKKLIGALSGASEEFLVSLKYGKSICIWRDPD